jgi:hypothetical protein
MRCRAELSPLCAKRAKLDLLIGRQQLGFPDLVQVDPGRIEVAVA